MATTPAEGMASLYRNLEEATGKSIDQWAAIACDTGILKHKALCDHIKKQFGLSHGYANQIALRALTAANVTADDLIEQQYSGAKAAIKPLYDALVHACSALGGDIEFAPKKAYVSVRRSKQFAIIQPASGRIDVGLVLKDVPSTARLEAAGSFNAMVTHRVRVSEAQQIDPELIDWLRAAYQIA